MLISFIKCQRACSNNRRTNGHENGRTRVPLFRTGHVYGVGQHPTTISAHHQTVGRGVSWEGGWEECSENRVKIIKILRTCTYVHVCLSVTMYSSYIFVYDYSCMLLAWHKAESRVVTHMQNYTQCDC